MLLVGRYLARNLFSGLLECPRFCYTLLVCSLILARSVLHLAYRLLSFSCIVGFANKILTFHSFHFIFIFFSLILPLAFPSFHPVSVVSPLNVTEFARDLSGHPDREAISYVLNGLQHGFRLGFQPSRRFKSAKSNKLSARQHPAVIDDYLATEVALHRLAGPVDSPSLPNPHVSSFGVIPKKSQPGKWRLIVDLLSPTGSSVNDGITAEDFSMQYITVDQIIHMVSKYGPGALMGKL